MSGTDWWWCSRGEHPTDDPHTDPETGDDVCPEHCATCVTGLAEQYGIDDIETIDDTRVRVAPFGPTDPDDPGFPQIAGHGSLTQDQAARGEAGAA